jgi:CheY-like chemotaxis protein
VTSRASLEDESEFAIWRFSNAMEEATTRRVMIGHRDKVIGESLLLLLSLKGFDVVYADDVIKLDRFLAWWKPQAILLDTRLDSDSNYQFTRAVRSDPSNAGTLLLAMSNIWPLDPITSLKHAGFDGHCRRPCSLWRVVDILDGYFARASALGSASRH